MSKTFRTLLTFAVAASVFGYFRAWYTVSRLDAGEQTNITVTIDRARIRADLQRASDRVRRFVDHRPSNDDNSASLDYGGYEAFSSR